MEENKFCHWECLLLPAVTPCIQKKNHASVMPKLTFFFKYISHNLLNFLYVTMHFPFLVLSIFRDIKIHDHQPILSK